MANGNGIFSLALGSPYIPKVIPITPDALPRLYRWQLTLSAHAAKESGESTQRIVPPHCCVTIRLDPQKHRRRDFIQLAGKSGLLAFEVLTVTTLPLIQYLLYAAVSDSGDWGDGLILEGLFDSAVSAREVDCFSDASLRQVEFGLECHRQLSLAHWNEQRTVLLNNVESDCTEHYASTVSQIEERIADVRRQLKVEDSPAARSSLVAARAALRNQLLDAECTEAEVAQFLIQLRTQPPQHELQRLFTIEWFVEPMAK